MVFKNRGRYSCQSTLVCCLRKARWLRRSLGSNRLSRYLKKKESAQFDAYLRPATSEEKLNKLQFFLCVCLFVCFLFESTDSIQCSILFLVTGYIWAKQTSTEQQSKWNAQLKMTVIGLNKSTSGQWADNKQMIIWCWITSCYVWQKKERQRETEKEWTGSEL